MNRETTHIVFFNPYFGEHFFCEFAENILGFCSGSYLAFVSRFA